MLVEKKSKAMIVPIYEIIIIIQNLFQYFGFEDSFFSSFESKFSFILNSYSHSNFLINVMLY